MLHTLKLLLPALFPSWRFFDVIAPSPRIQNRILTTENDTQQNWHEFRPQPAHLTTVQILKRLFWNAQWNETLYLISCAEQILQHPLQHIEDEINRRISRDLKKNTTNSLPTTATHLQFRLLTVQRQDNELHQQICFYSQLHAL